MSESQTKQKIVWAVDPFCEEPAVLKSAAWAIRALAKGEATEVLPLHVLTSAPLEVPIRVTPELQQSLERKGQGELDPITTRIKLPGIRPLQILSENYLSRREEAQALVTAAKELGADVIVLSAHGRKGLKRLLMGSFAETLVLHSDVPLFIVHPDWRRVPTFKKILFATDFSPESKEAFRKVIEFAKPKNCRILIFHKLLVASYVGIDPTLIARDVYESHYNSIKDSMEAEARRLAGLAEKAQVQADIIIDRTSRCSVAEAILKRAKRFEAMIALASESGPVSAVLLGSTTRQVMRGATQPVWVLHPAAARVESTAHVTHQHSDRSAVLL